MHYILTPTLNLTDQQELFVGLRRYNYQFLPPQEIIVEMIRGRYWAASMHRLRANGYALITSG